MREFNARQVSGGFAYYMCEVSFRMCGINLPISTPNFLPPDYRGVSVTTLTLPNKWATSLSSGMVSAMPIARTTNTDTAVDRAQRTAPGEKLRTTNNALFIAVPSGVTWF